MWECADTPEFNVARQALTRRLAEQRGISPEVLRTISGVWRHCFVPKELRHEAYADKPLPIGEGQTISQPFTVAFMTTLLDLQPGMKVLEVGTGSGYQTAILETLGVEVFSVEKKRLLLQKAQQTLKMLGYTSSLFLADGSLGAAQFGLYDRILVTAGAPQIPEALLQQLAIKGKMVIPVGTKKSQRMLRLTKVKREDYLQEDFGAFRFVPLIGKQGW